MFWTYFWNPCKILRLAWLVPISGKIWIMGKWPLLYPTNQINPSISKKTAGFLNFKLSRISDFLSWKNIEINIFTKWIHYLHSNVICNIKNVAIIMLMNKVDDFTIYLFYLRECYYLYLYQPYYYVFDCFTVVM